MEPLVVLALGDESASAAKTGVNPTERRRQEHGQGILGANSGGDLDLIAKAKNVTR